MFKGLKMLYCDTDFNLMKYVSFSQNKYNHKIIGLFNWKEFDYNEIKNQLQKQQKQKAAVKKSSPPKKKTKKKSDIIYVTVELMLHYLFHS